MICNEQLKRATWQCVHFADARDAGSAVVGLDTAGIVTLIATAENLQNEVQLLMEIARAMRFPDYFGANWDALDECLRDMEWISAKGYVLLMHDATPLWTTLARGAAKLIESWLLAAEDWSHQEVPFHLVFLW